MSISFILKGAEIVDFYYESNRTYFTRLGHTTISNHSLWFNVLVQSIFGRTPILSKIMQQSVVVNEVKGFS